jgi:glycosyltransferase involved in cell wall biosynthesis
MSIRVVRIIDRLNIGGPAKHVTWLTAGLPMTEFKTTLITGTVPPHEGDMSWFAEQAGVKPVVVKEMSREIGLRDVLVVYNLWRMFVRLKPHIIHTHKAKAGAAGRLAAWLYRWFTVSSLWGKPRSCRTVHTFHGHVFHGYYGAAKSKLFVTIERVLALWFSHRIVTISEQQRREINEDYKVGRIEQFRVIPLGIDCSEQQIANPSKSLHAEFDLPADTLTVGIVGRLCSVKNHALFLQAVAELQRLAPDLAHRTHFFILGDGELREELMSLAKALKLTNRVTFTGFRQDIAALYGDLDVVALSSVNEGTPLTLIEAMNCGCAVLATEVGGVIDILGARVETRDGMNIWQHGVTVPSGDTAAFAKGLAALLMQPDMRRAMGVLGQSFVRQNLSRERLLKDIARLYRELAAEESFLSHSDALKE